MITSANKKVHRGKNEHIQLMRHRTMTSLEYLIFNVTDFTDRLFFKLGASYTAMIVAITGYSLSDERRKLYLNPMRDLPEYEDWVQEMIKTDHTVTLVGKDLYLLMDRITRPLGFWHMHKGEEQFVIWMAVMRKKKFKYMPEDLGIDRDVTTYSPENIYEAVKDIDPALLTHGWGGYSTDFITPLGAWVPLHEMNTDSIPSWTLAPIEDNNNITIIQYNSISDWDLPGTVIVWTDNDIAGYPCEHTSRFLITTTSIRLNAETNPIVEGDQHLTAYINVHIDPFTAKAAWQYANPFEVVSSDFMWRERKAIIIRTTVDAEIVIPTVYETMSSRRS